MKSRHLYTLLLYLLLPAILVRLWLRSLRAPDYRKRWAERFGISPARPQSPLSGTLWVHAVSVGETLAAVPLVRTLLQRYPALPVVLTTTTPTGSAEATKLFAAEITSGHVLHVYAPYDLPGAIARFLQRMNPRLLVLMETEIWPNTLQACAQRNIPVVLANARLSEKSARGYARVRSLSAEALHAITAIAAQHELDAARFIALGAHRESVLVTGSIKFDLEISAAARELAAQLKTQWSDNGTRVVWLAASTHAGEDEILLEVFARLKSAHPSLRLVLVPRHPERFGRVYQLCFDRGFHPQRRSEHSTINIATDIILGDTMGELLAFYGACDIAFVGGSLVPVGGHNLIEPAAWAKPVISGSHLHNFAEIAALLRQNNALLTCSTASELEREIAALLPDAGSIVSSSPAELSSSVSSALR